MARMIRDWQALDPEQRLGLGAAVALFVTMLLPWYQQNGFVKTKTEVRADSHNLTAFGAFSFVEAAVLLVALAVGYLFYARAEGHRFHVPGSDGAVVLAAGLWTVLLLVYRLFDKPSISSHGVAANVGVQWGIFFALAAAGLLAYAGSRMRNTYRAAAHAGLGPRVSRDRRSGSERRERERPPSRDEQPAGEELTAVRSGRGDAPAPPERPPGETPAARARPRYPPAPAEQMSFDDSPPPAD